MYIYGISIINITSQHVQRVATSLSKLWILVNEVAKIPPYNLVLITSRYIHYYGQRCLTFSFCHNTVLLQGSHGNTVLLQGSHGNTVLLQGSHGTWKNNFNYALLLFQVRKKRKNSSKSMKYPEGKPGIENKN